jgi:2-polyprenyl-3-methyl-5-hydroxy-6-metoxy-1,4-benzoquinol methylase
MRDIGKLGARDANRRVQVAHFEGKEVVDFPRIEKVVSYLRRRPAGTLLDIGYLKGSFADYMADYGWECLGVDLSPLVGSKVGTVRCDLNEGLPIATGKVDAVTAGEVIEHMFHDGDFLDECRRVLKKGGTLDLTTPNLTFGVNRLLVLAGRVPMFTYAPYHYQMYTRTTLVNLVERHGFEVEKLVSSHVLYSRRRHFTGRVFELLGDWFPTFGAHLILFARRQ